MKKRTKIIVSAAGAAVIVIIIIVSPYLSMKPAATGEIPGAGIYAVKDKIVCLYLIDTGGGYIAVDAGIDSKGISNTLAGLGIPAEKVTHVFLTHSDADHTAATTLFTNAQICMSEDEIQLLDGTTKRTGAAGNQLPGRDDLSGITLLGSNQTLTIGGRTIECIKAPGHTPGSMLYLIDGKYLFTGDAFKAKNGARSVHPYTMDKKTASATIRSLDGLLSETEMILTAHYGCFPAG